MLILLSPVMQFRTAYTQPSYLPLNRDVMNHFEETPADANATSRFHTSIKPYLETEANEFFSPDSYRDDSLKNASNPKPFEFNNKILGRKGGFASLAILPLFELQAGWDAFDGIMILKTGLGAMAAGSIGTKISLNAAYFAGNAGFVNYLDSFIQENEVIPGLGYAHKTKTGYANSYYDGYISYSPSEKFNFQLGQGKNFWGNGYRSLLLSDLANSYPFLKITTNVWKIKYINLYAVLNDVHNSGGKYSAFKNKYATFHYLSWNTTKWLNIGLFESIIWQGADSSGTRGYDVNYLNPVIFYRPVEYSLGSSDNALMGANVKIQITGKLQLYGQLILDEFFLKEIRAQNGWWANKQGFQAGIKGMDLFKIKGLCFQTEFNYVRPYTYSHGLALQNYSHYNQPLAHPLGSNFYESVSFLSYRRQRLLLEAMLMYAVHGDDTSGSNWGGNIFLDYKSPRVQDYGNKVGQGIKTTIAVEGIRASYLVYLPTNFKIELGIAMRSKVSDVINEYSVLIFFGIRTAITNIYSDF